METEIQRDKAVGQLALDRTSEQEDVVTTIVEEEIQYPSGIYKWIRTITREEKSRRQKHQVNIRILFLIGAVGGFLALLEHLT